ncbi:MAG: MFS transporter [Planctomycetota bacterium]|nr:MFS transporter [Planctomycetota bacterium]
MSDSPDSNLGSSENTLSAGPWYAGVTRYQWIVLAIASVGWVFDVYEGQIFNITRNDMLTEVLGGESADVTKYGDLFLGIFLLGGTVGGLGAGTLADRFGRRPIMMLTILMYSIFSGLTYFATELWHVAALRFLVAMGVGGEWAVAASLVSEIFPARARAHASGIFHASSVLGTWMATLAGMAVGAQWRYAYLIGIVPALLILWVRATVKEPEQWKAKAAQGKSAQLGSFKDLLTNPRWNRNAMFGMLLGAVGLGTFWAVGIATQDLAREMLIEAGEDPENVSQKSKFAYGIIQTAGGGLGLLAFGPLCARFGRRRAFIGMQLLAFLIVPVTCYGPQNYQQLLFILPVYGFLTLGIHAGYAIYFPELFPTHLRATGTSFCFNGGRILAVPVLIFSAWLKAKPDMDLRLAISSLAVLFLAGAVVMLFLPETNKQELPE